MKTNTKSVFIWMITLLLLFSVSPTLVIATVEDECVTGGGEWTTPTIAQGDDPTTKELKPYCKCEVGSFWNDSSKKCENDDQIRCLQTQGQWINESCSCPEGTIKWTEGFGCDMPGPEPKLESSKNDSDTLGPPTSVLVVGIILAVLILFFMWKKIRRRKANEVQ